MNPCLKLGKIYVAETRNRTFYIGTYTGFARDSQSEDVMYYIDNVTKYKSFWSKTLLKN